MGEPGARILLVDDDSFVCEMMTLILEARGYEVEAKTHPEEALDRLKAQPPFDLIVSDMNMPGMGGIDLIRAAREAGVDSAAILLTGDPADGKSDEIARLRIDAWVAKDASLQESMPEIVSDVLERRRHAGGGG